MEPHSPRPRIGGEEEDHQQHPHGEGAEKHGNNSGEHFWGDTDDEDDGLSTGLPEVDDWPNDQYTPCQEARLSNTVMHTMRFIMVKDDNNLTPLEENSQERSRRRMTQPRRIQRLMVCPHREQSALQHMAEVGDRQVHGEEFPVGRTIFALGGGELL